MKKRETVILEFLNKETRLDVVTLAQQLGVSQVTVRKDLDSLEQKGFLRREHGYAVLRSPNDVSGRLANHYEEKLCIAKKAAELVSDGDTVMIENGSCCALLAEVLAETRQDLTIVTNSAFIADYIRRKANFQIALLGGVYQHDSQVMVGPMVRQCAENFFVKHFFIGVDGHSEDIGFTNQDQLRAQAVRDMARQAERVVIVTESEKFRQRGTVPLNLAQTEMLVVTDEQIPQDVVSCLNKRDVHVLVA